MSKLINRSNVKKVALNKSTRDRAGKFHRVSGGFFDKVERALSEKVCQLALSLPEVPAKVVNRKNVKVLIADERRRRNLPEAPVRVSDFERLENELVAYVEAEVQNHPSTGVTLMA